MKISNVVTSARAMRGWSWALLVANVTIILTGGVVRLTGSGLGCPTWPQCTPGSFVTTPAMGFHGVIEFGNRMVAISLSIIAVVTFLVSLSQRDRHGARRRDLVWLTLLLGIGIPLQAVIGGLSVLMKLNPSIVSPHLLLSMLLVAGSVVLVHRTHGRRPRVAANGGGWLPVAVIVCLSITMVLGTVVTGSGPHAGSSGAVRNGFNPATVSHIHAASVYLTVFATIVAMVWLRSKAALLLLAIEVAQGIVGFVQYYTALPIDLVMLHLLGASLAMAASTNLLLLYRVSAVSPSDAPTQAPVAGSEPLPERQRLG